MDIIERHFAAENAHDVPATLTTCTDDVIWDDVGNPACPVRGKAATSGMDEGIMAAIPDLRIESALRFGDTEHVVDEAVACGHVEGSFLGVEGGGAPVRFRMLHVFDLRDGLIAREQAWFDTAGVLRQIDEHRHDSGHDACCSRRRCRSLRALIVGSAPAGENSTLGGAG